MPSGGRGERMMRKKLPVGIESFEKLRREDFYYVDKTGLIRDLLYNWGEVNLFTRPRRFGKSLNMSMLKTFFEIGCDRSLFQSLEIMKEATLCEDYMGKFPVIFVSLKGVGAQSFSAALGMLKSLIGNEALRFSFLLESSLLNETEKRQYQALINLDTEGHFRMSEEVLTNSLWTLGGLLERHYGRKVILLIDEYDVPLDKAEQYGYYDEMALAIRNLFQQALKGNDSLQFAVLTGCLRISKESIFTGLNNPKVLSVTESRFDEYFGFTDAQVRKMLADYGIGDCFGTVKEWYDGYHFGKKDVYCPWDVINYCDSAKDDPSIQPEPYWGNTSDNRIVRRLLQKADRQTRNEIEKLIAGEAITKTIRQELTYKDLDSSIENIWSVLFMTGYLTQCGRLPDNRWRLMIPNLEIRWLFETQIRAWFEETAVGDSVRLQTFCTALLEGDAEKVEKELNIYLRSSISIRDSSVRKAKKENFYHGFLLGLLKSMEGTWSVFSNEESGDGYSDILIEAPEQGVGVVIELKYAERGDFAGACREALTQIEKRGYTETLELDGMETIIRYGIACFRKRCRVQKGHS